MHKFFQDDVGRALTASQMAEYREAFEARMEGRDNPRLRWAAHVSTSIIVSALVVWLFITAYSL